MFDIGIGWKTLKHTFRYIWFGVLQLVFYVVSGRKKCYLKKWAFQMKNNICFPLIGSRNEEDALVPEASKITIHALVFCVLTITGSSHRWCFVL